LSRGRHHFREQHAARRSTRRACAKPAHSPEFREIQGARLRRPWHFAALPPPRDCLYHLSHATVPRGPRPIKEDRECGR
jgi:hypothetical protein